MTTKQPVTDWVHDFDHTDPTYVADPYPIWEELRARQRKLNVSAWPELFGEEQMARYFAFSIAPFIRKALLCLPHQMF